MIRLRVSMLDAWVAYIEPERPEFEVSTEEFVSQLKREAEANDAMRAGTAFHSLMERAVEGVEYGDLEGIEVDGFRFYFDGDFSVPLPALREHETEPMVFDTPSGPVSLQGRVDARNSFTVTDYKLTGRFDAERYGRSLQWRAYLLLTGCRRFRYLAFENKRKGSDVWISDIHALDFWAYPKMWDDVERRVYELAEFIAAHVPEMVEPLGPVEAMAAEYKRLAGSNVR